MSGEDKLIRNEDMTQDEEMTRDEAFRELREQTLFEDRIPLRVGYGFFQVGGFVTYVELGW